MNAHAEHVGATGKLCRHWDRHIHNFGVYLKAHCAKKGRDASEVFECIAWVFTVLDEKHNDSFVDV